MPRSGSWRSRSDKATGGSDVADAAADGNNNGGGESGRNADASPSSLTSSSLLAPARADDDSNTAFPPPPPPPQPSSASSSSGAPLNKHSIHGEGAARRQAASELLFFAGVGDVERCKQIAADWRLDARTAADYDRRTPLHLAAAEGAYSVVQWLLEDVKAPANPVDRFLRTPLEEAALGDHGEVVALLQRHGGRVVASSSAAEDSLSAGAREAKEAAAAAAAPAAAPATVAAQAEAASGAPRLVPLEQSRLAGAVRIFGARTAAAAHAGPTEEQLRQRLLEEEEARREQEQGRRQQQARLEKASTTAAATTTAGAAAAMPMAMATTTAPSIPPALLTTPEWEINPAHLRIGPAIGEGEFGTVHASTWHGAPVAVKILKRSDDVALGDFRTELNVLQKVHHPGCVQFYGAITRSRPLMLVTELVSGGSVADLLRASRQGLAPRPSATRAAQLALDTARGLLYLHSRQAHVVIHRDLKPGNLLISLGARLPAGLDSRRAAAAYGFAKISDFGLSKSLAMRAVVGSAAGVTGAATGSLAASASAAALATLAEEEEGKERRQREEEEEKKGKEEKKEKEERRRRSESEGGGGGGGGKGDNTNNKSAGGGGGGGGSGSRGAGPWFAKEDETSTYKLTGETGSYRYMAPEVFRHEPYNSKVDVYSFAIILFELLDGGVPFTKKVHPLDAARRAALLHARPGWGMGATSKGLRRAPRPPPPPALRALVEDCWKPDPAARPEFGEICRRLEAALAELPPDKPPPRRLLLGTGSGAGRKGPGGCVVQ